MIVNVGGYVFGYDAEDCMLRCFKNRRLRCFIEMPNGISSREQLIACAKKLTSIIENVPEEYFYLLNREDLEENET